MDVNKLLLKFFKKHINFIIGYVIFMIAYPITSVILPKYYGQVVDDLKSNKKPNFIPVVVMLLVTIGLYTILDYMDAVFMPKLQSYIRTYIVKVVLENYKEKYEEQELGTLMSKIVKFPIIVRSIVGQFRNNILPLCLVFVAVVIRFMMVDRTIGMMVLFGLLICGLVIGVQFCKCLNIALETDNVADSGNENIAELFDNLLDIYSMNTMEKEMEKLENNQKEIAERYKKTYNCSNTLKIYINFLAVIIFFSIIYYAYTLFRNKKMNIPDMVNVTITSMYIISKMGSLAGEIPDLVFNVSGYIHTKRFLGDIDDNNKEEDFEINNGKVSFENVDISYGNKKIINDFNLEIKSGESIAIIGRIGSGKSTIVKALLKLIPYEGKIELGGYDISKIDGNKVRSKILYIRQNPIPFNRTLYDNIVYGVDNVSEKEVKDLLNKYNLFDFFDHKLDDKVGRKGGKLSGGQRQMIFLLRVLLSKNPVVILDEPTSSLDEKSAKYIWKILEDILSTRTVLLITHDNKLGDLCDRKINISDYKEKIKIN